MRKLLMFAVLLATLVAAVPFAQQLSARGATAQAPKPPPTAARSPLVPPTVAAGSAAPAVTRLELNDQQVTQLLRDGLTRRGYQIDDLAVRLEEGRFVATSSQQVSFFRVPVTVIGEASVVDGQLSVRPVSVTAGGAPVPQAVVDQTAATFRSELAAQLNDLPLRPVSIQILPGRLVVQGMPTEIAP